MFTVTGRIGWLFIGLWFVLVGGVVFAIRSGLEPQDCCYPDELVVAFTTFVIAVFTTPVAVIGVFMINRGIGLDRVPKTAVLTVIAGVFTMPILAAIVVNVL